MPHSKRKNPSPKPAKPAQPSRPRRVRDPLASPEFKALRAVQWSLAQGGLPPAAERTPAEEARIVTFFALQELLRLLDEFAHARMRGEPCRLVVEEEGTEQGRAVIDLRIVK